MFLQNGVQLRLKAALRAHYVPRGARPAQRGQMNLRSRAASANFAYGETTFSRVR